ncbi:hypothetical protein Ccrd_008418, partial [Cynara cardunculus var. scolymus]
RPSLFWAAFGSDLGDRGSFFHLLLSVYCSRHGSIPVSICTANPNYYGSPSILCIVSYPAVYDVIDFCC